MDTSKTMIRQNVPIFISSTYGDLIPYREEVQRVLLRLEQIVKGMEYFGSNPESPLEVCLKSVRESRIFVGIIGMKYGSVEETNKKSFTQLEYEEAIKQRIPTLIYIISEEQPIPSKYVDTGDTAKSLLEFKKTLMKKHTITYFTTPEDLGKKLTQDLYDILATLDEIKLSGSIANVTAENFQEIFKKFMFRPAKHALQEGNLTIKVTNAPKSCGSIKANVITALGMTLGDTVCVQVRVIDENTLESLSDTLLYLYGERELGDWLEQVPTDTIAFIKTRLEYSITKEITPYDGGTVLRDVAYSSLVLLAVVSEEIPSEN